MQNTANDWPAEPLQPCYIDRQKNYAAFFGCIIARNVTDLNDDTMNSARSQNIIGARGTATNKGCDYNLNAIICIDLPIFEYL